MGTSQHSRRSVLRSAAVGGLVIGAGPVLAACSGSSAPSDTSSGANTTSAAPTTSSPSGGGQATATSPTATGAPGGGAALPTFKPFSAAQPDFPPTAAGVDAGYLKYPAKPVKVYDTKPGTGGDVSAFAVSYGAPTTLQKNVYWQHMNDRLGVNLQWRLTPREGYAAKLATTIAGGDIPDYMQIIEGQLPNTPDVLEAEFADLTDFLAGDAVNNYPSLANVPTQAWKSLIVKGRIYGLPTPRQATGTLTLVRRDIAKKLGLDYNVTTTDEYMELCKAFTDVKANRWALSGTSSELGSIPNWFGAPNGWAREDDKFVNMYETDNWRAALDFMNQLYKAGVWYPDAFAIDGTTAARLFFKGTSAIWTTGTNGYLGNMVEARAADPDYDPDFILPFDVNGGVGMQPTGVANYSLTAVKKAKKSRVEELIRIADWLAAPFGTDEYTLAVYGVEGRNFTWKDGNPTPVPSTDPGANEVMELAYRYISAAPIVLYSPQYTDYVKAIYATEKKLLEHPRDDASLGLYSPTKAKSWPSVAKDLGQASLDVIQGRKSLKDWDAAVARQKKAIDAVNTEFAESYAQANG